MPLYPPHLLTTDGTRGCDGIVALWIRSLHEFAVTPKYHTLGGLNNNRIVAQFSWWPEVQDPGVDRVG